MNEKSKATCYQKIYKEMKGLRGVEGLGFPAVRSNYDFYFTTGLLSVNYSLKKGQDLLSIRAEAEIPSTVSEEAARDFCFHLLEGSGYRGYAENGKMAVTYSLVVTGLSSDAAEKKVHEGAFDFIRFLVSHATEIEDFFVSGAYEIKEPEDEQNEEVVSPEEVESPGAENDPIPFPDTEKAPVMEDSPMQAEENKTAFSDSDSEETRNHFLFDAEDVKEETPAEAPSKKEAVIETPEKKDDKQKKKEGAPKAMIPDAAEEKDLSQKREEFEQFCDAQMQDIERRMAQAKRMEDQIDAKLTDYGIKHQELSDLKETVDATKAENERVSADLMERGLLTKELANKEKLILILQKSLDAKEKELERNYAFSQLSGTVQPQEELQELNTYKEELQQCKESLETANATIRQLRTQMDQLKKESEDLARLKKGQSVLTDRVHALEQENTTLKTQLADAASMEAALKEAKNDVAEAEAALAREQALPKQGTDITLFEDAGYTIKEIVGEREGLYTVSGAMIPDGVEVAIDTVHGVALVQKPLRRGKKYGQMVRKWNEEDLASGYILYNDGIIIKKPLFENAVAETEQAVKSIEPLR